MGQNQIPAMVSMPVTCWEQRLLSLAGSPEVGTRLLSSLPKVAAGAIAAPMPVAEKIQDRLGLFQKKVTGLR
jgi:hypothetical protein